MNYLDILLFIPLIIGAWRGFKKGFIIELFTFLALLVGIYAGIHFSDFVANMLRNGLSLTSDYVPVIAFTLTFLVVGAGVYFAGKMLERVIKVVALSAVNKFFGLLFGLLKMLFFASAVLVIIESFDEKGQFFPQELKDSSLLYHPVKKVSLTAIPALKYSHLFVKAVQ